VKSWRKSANKNEKLKVKKQSSTLVNPIALLGIVIWS